MPPRRLPTVRFLFYRTGPRKNRIKAQRSGFDPERRNKDADHPNGESCGFDSDDDSDDGSA